MSKWYLKINICKINPLNFIPKISSPHKFCTLLIGHIAKAKTLQFWHLICLFHQPVMSVELPNHLLPSIAPAPLGFYHSHCQLHYRSFLIGSLPTIATPPPLFILDCRWRKESFKILSQPMSPPCFQSFSASHESSLKNIQRCTRGP